MFRCCSVMFACSCCWRETRPFVLHWANSVPQLQEISTAMVRLDRTAQVYLKTITITKGGRGRVHTEKSENAPLFLRIGLPSTLTRHENGAFWKGSSNRRNFKKAGFAFYCGQKTLRKRSFSGTMASQKSCETIWWFSQRKRVFIFLVQCGQGLTNDG